MIKVGCCGFPISMKQYFKEFNVVELNNTFYKIPSEETVRRWRREAPENFEFTIKAFQGITHDVSSPTWKKSGIPNYKELKGRVGFLRPTKEVFEFWDEMEKIAKILKSKIILLQLPSSFKDTDENIKNAYEFFKTILPKTNLKIAIELRGWKIENIRKICEEFDLIDVVDPFRREPVYDSKIKYYRLHGTYKGNKIVYYYKYTSEELQKLKEIVLKNHREESYVMFNNVYMYQNAKEFISLISH